jgi:3-phenylpropionate/trans-cinnamate dioxygenase ferredoxin reductase component
MATHVQLSNGESIPCDMIFVAIGSEPCTELCRDSSIEMTNNGFIRVNQRLETSIEHVLAIGDMCQYPLNIFQIEQVNCQHWQMACSTGHQAGRSHVLCTIERI